MRGPLQLVGLLSIVGGLALAFIQYLNTPVSNSPEWFFVAVYALSGLLGSVIPFGLAEVLRRAEDIQSNLAALRDDNRSGSTTAASKK